MTYFIQKSGQAKISIFDISHISCSSYVSTVFCGKTQKNYSFTKLLKEFEKELSAHGFIRVNRNTIVNPKYIKQIITGSERSIILNSGIEISISRRKWSNVKKNLILFSS